MEVGVAPSSPAHGFSNFEEEIKYYKTQYEQLEAELQEFQSSSRELEAELEKEAEASEKKVRDLKKKVEGLNYEVDEWKNKYKQSKTEANNAQTSLQKEVTSLRDTNRTLQLRLRDIEVANDDYERQARNTTSSLEDMESKYNVTLERSVMLEEEIKSGEQEREQLRIETQRLRDELSDLKVEAEITQEKLRSAESVGLRSKRISQISDPQEHGPRSPTSETSILSESQQSNSTPPPLKTGVSATNSDAPTPPSPPLSEHSNNAKSTEPTATARKPSVARDPHTTPRPSHYGISQTRHTRGPSLAVSGTTPSFARSTASRPSYLPQEPLPRSGSLYQIRGLIGKMQKLEQRVHSARSKLPAPTNTPPRVSPRGGTNGAGDIPSSVTVRSGRKASHLGASESSTPSRQTQDASLRRSQSRMSFGTPSGASRISRPSSQASFVSADAPQAPRPGSRTSMHSGRSGVEHYRPSSALDGRRSRSSISGNYATSHTHRPSQQLATSEEEQGNTGFSTPTARRTTLDKNGINSAIPGPSTPSTLRGRASVSGLNGTPTPGRRQSFKVGAHVGHSGSMGPPGRPSQQQQQQQQYDDDNTY